MKSESEAKIELLKYLFSKIDKVDQLVSTEQQRDQLIKNLDLCHFNIEQRRLFANCLRSEPPATIREVAPMVAMLYDARKILDNQTAISIEEWNRQILNKLDTNLNQMEQKYRHWMLQCLMMELSKSVPKVQEYVEKWYGHIDGKDVK